MAIFVFSILNLEILPLKYKTSLAYMDISLVYKEHANPAVKRLYDSDGLKTQDS